MRIIGGALKGRTISAPKGLDVRPTTDRVREALFNRLTHGGLLTAGFDSVAVLDLFAGSGALGLEALSRGAAFAVFVETAAPARAAIQANIEALSLAGRTKLFRRDAARLGRRPGTVKRPFDLVFCDPPYGKGLAPLALQAALCGDWLAPRALIVLEENAREEAPVVDGFSLIDWHRYGDTALAFLRRT